MPAQTRKVITDGLALGYRYDPSPIVWPDGTPAPEDTVSDYHPTARPGSRAPHACHRDRPLDHRPVRQGLRADAAWRGGARRVADRARVRAARRAARRSRRIDNPDVAALYERKLVLVRPDGHVAWRADAPPADPLALADRVRGA